MNWYPGSGIAKSATGLFLKKNPSVIIRALTVDVGNTVVYILNHINFIKETLVLIGVFILLLYFDPAVSFFIFTFGFSCEIFKIKEFCQKF